MDFDGTICLHHAASNDQPEMCRFLIESGCKVNQTDKLGRTPLMDAAEIGSIKVIDALIEKQADVNMEDRENHTALSYCIDFVSDKEPKFIKCAIRLVQCGANPNYPGKFAKRTLLHCAAAQGNFVVVHQLLCDYKAVVRVFDGDRKMPVDYARKHNHQRVEELLQAADVPEGGMAEYCSFHN